MQGRDKKDFKNKSPLASITTEKRIKEMVTIGSSSVSGLEDTGSVILTSL